MKKLISSLAIPIIFYQASVQAEIVKYTFSGNYTVSVPAVYGDPVADLLKIPRAAETSVPTTIEYIVDTGSRLNIKTNTAQTQEVTYSDALKTVKVIVNGVKFETNQLQEIDMDGSIIDVSNTIDPSGNDSLTSSIAIPDSFSDVDNDTSHLLNYYTLPFNQMIQGEFSETAQVKLGLVVTSIMNKTGKDAAVFLNNYSIPTDTGSINSQYVFSSFAIQVILNNHKIDDYNSTVVFTGVKDISVSVSPAKIPEDIGSAVISNDRVFGYAEANYSSLFPGTASNQLYQDYTYRYYPETGNYLGVKSSGVIYLYGSVANNTLSAVGPVSQFKDKILEWEAKQ